MTPVIGNTDFSGGLNVRDLGHLIGANEATLAEGFSIEFSSVRTLDGDIRELIDVDTYPEIVDACLDPMPGTGGGVPNNEPILGCWRYYYNDGAQGYNAWVRVHGTTVEFWGQGSGAWVRIGNDNWPNGAVPTAVQFKDSIYIFHGVLNTSYMGKYLFNTGGSWFAGDIPIPGYNETTAVAFVGAGLNDMTRTGTYTGTASRTYRVQIERNPLGPVQFYGAGLNDMTAGGAYGGAEARTYLVEIDWIDPAGLAPDTFRWSDNGGGTWTAGVAITGAAQVLNNGVSVTFVALLGHTLGEFWGFECGPTDAIRWSTNAGTSWDVSNIPVFAGVPITLSDGFTVTFAAGVGHTVTNYWNWTITVSDIPNLRPAFAVVYRNRLYAVSPANEPFTIRYSGVNLPQQWEAPEGGYVTLGDSSGDPITGLFVHKDVLLIFRRSSVWRYWVDEGGWEHLGRLHGAAGCLTHNSICAYKDAVYYASMEGMISIYGADSDCITHKIGREIDPDPDYIKYIQAVVHAKSGTLWVTYLEKFITDNPTVDSSGDPILDIQGVPATHYIFNTDVWRADIRRPNIIKPRWVKLPYYRLTCFAMPPQSNTYKGNDLPNLHFCAQQPDVTEWEANATADALYPNYQDAIHGDLGGPRHYNYRFGVAFDRDQVPAYNDGCGDPLYAGDHGVGYWLRFKTPRYLPVGNMRDVGYGDMRLDYFIWKGQAGLGLDTAYSRLWVDHILLMPTDPAFPLDPSLWPIRDNTLDAGIGGAAFQEYRLSNMNPSSGKSLMMEWTVIGLSSRVRYSWAVEFRFWGCEYDAGTDKLNPED